MGTNGCHMEVAPQPIPCADRHLDAATDRRRRNSEAAKRSRAKSRVRQLDMEDNYDALCESHQKLRKQNAQLREMIARLGGDTTTVSAIEPSSNGILPSIRAKRQRAENRIENRVTPTAENSSESEDTQNDNNTSQQSETTKRLAVATTVLILMIFQSLRSLSSITASSAISPRTDPDKAQYPPSHQTSTEVAETAVHGQKSQAWMVSRKAQATHSATTSASSTCSSQSSSSTSQLASASPHQMI